MSNPRGPIESVPKHFRGPWEGENKIVVGIDIGTTQSGVAFAYLEKGQEQIFQRVTQWPGQKAEKFASETPTLVWYNADNEAVSFGAEALSPEAEDDAEDNGWHLAKHFKLQLNPGSIRSQHGSTDPLPPGVSLLKVYSDFLGYLLRHTQTFFEDRVVDGKLLWLEHRSTMQFIITHPNGWGIREQAFLRNVATNAGLVTNMTAATYVQFVTEAEASVYFGIHRTNLGNVLKPGTKFAVCDAGSSTVDTTLYSVISVRQVLKLKEERVPASVQAGFIFVEAAVEQYLQGILRFAALVPEDVVDYAKRGVKDFKNSVKWAFKDETNTHSIELAGPRVNYPGIGVRRGRINLSGSTIRTFFGIHINKIIESVNQQLAGLTAPHILLMGEFGNSAYLRQVFQKQYEPQGCQIFPVDNYSCEAIASGAVMWGAINCSRQRTPRSAWGIEMSVAYNYDDPDHRDRKSNRSSTSGRTVVPGRWHCLVQKGVAIDKDTIVRIPISLDFPPSSPELDEFKLDLYTYSGDEEPVWMRNKQGILLPNFCKAVRIYQNLQDLRGALKSRITRDRILQGQLNFDVCMRFGGAELVAYPEWEEEGLVQTGRCTLVPIIDEA